VKGLTIIIPAYNEEKRIVRAASMLFSSRYLAQNCKFLFIVDGNDRTGKMLEKIEKGMADVSVKEYPERLGKGGAGSEGIKAAETEYVGFVDVDSSIPVKTLEEIISKLIRGNLDCAIGKRMRVEGAPPMRKLSSRAFNILANILFGFGLSDTQCGCKFFRKSLVYSGSGDPLKTSGFAFDVELLEKIRKNGGKITEHGFVCKWGGTGSFSLLESPKMLWDILRLRFT